MERGKLTGAVGLLLGIGLILGIAVIGQANRPNPASENIVQTTSGDAEGCEAKVTELEIVIGGTPVSSPVYTWDLTDLKKYPAGGYNLSGYGKAKIEIWCIDEEGEPYLDGTLNPSVNGSLSFNDGKARVVKMSGGLGSSGVKDLEIKGGSATVFGKSKPITGLSFSGEWGWDEKEKNYGDDYNAVINGSIDMTLEYKEVEKSGTFPLSITVKRKISHLILYDYKAEPEVFCAGEEATISSNVNYDKALNWKIAFKNRRGKTVREFVGDNLPISCKWDGTKNGKPVKGGKYKYEISAWIGDEVSAEPVEGDVTVMGVEIITKADSILCRAPWPGKMPKKPTRLTLEAKGTPSGGEYTWSIISGSDKVELKSENSKAVVKGINSSDNELDVEIKVFYTLHGHICSTTHELTVRRPASADMDTKYYNSHPTQERGLFYWRYVRHILRDQFGKLIEVPNIPIGENLEKVEGFGFVLTGETATSSGGTFLDHLRSVKLFRRGSKWEQELRAGCKRRWRRAQGGWDVGHFHIMFGGETEEWKITKKPAS